MYLRKKTRIKLNRLSKYISLWQKYIREHGNFIGFMDCVREYLAWESSLQPGRSALGDRKPWIVFSSLRFLNSIIKPNDLVFEYGMGGSTLFFLDKNCRVVSIDHDSRWFQIVKKEISPEAKWKGFIVPPTRLNQNEHDDQKYRSEFPGYEKYCFKDYILTLSSYPDGYFDIIMVDGRCRHIALKVAKTKLSQNGILILDNAERACYKTAINELLATGWTERRFAGPGPYVDFEFWDTRVYTPSSV
jgi:hypothetical protein